MKKTVSEILLTGVFAAMPAIVAAASQKAAIMQSILKKAGPDSKAGTIVFSLPTTQVAGFALLDNQDET